MTRPLSWRIALGANALALVAALASIWAMHLLEHISDSEWLYHHTPRIALIVGATCALAAAIGAGAATSAAISAGPSKARRAFAAVVAVDLLLLAWGIVLGGGAGILELLRSSK